MATAEHIRSEPRLGDDQTQRLGGMMLADKVSPPGTTIVYDPDLVRRVETLGISEARSRLMVLAHYSRS